MLGRAGRTCVADPILVHVLGITLQGEACVSCPRAGPHHVALGACSADASPRSCVQPCRVSPSLCQCTSAPSDLQSGCEVAGLSPQASHTDFPAACLVPFQTTQMLLIKTVPIDVAVRDLPSFYYLIKIILEAWSLMLRLPTRMPFILMAGCCVHLFPENQADTCSL